MAEKNNQFLEYKGRPLVRCGKTVYYGNMSDPCVVCLTILSENDFEDIKLSGKVLIQLISTDPDLKPKDKIIKKSEKEGLYNALDLGAVWLERELKK